jgi:hypothetical protein
MKYKTTVGVLTRTTTVDDPCLLMIPVTIDVEENANQARKDALAREALGHALGQLVERHRSR